MMVHGVFPFCCSTARAPHTTHPKEWCHPVSVSFYCRDTGCIGTFSRKDTMSRTSRMRILTYKAINLWKSMAFLTLQTLKVTLPVHLRVTRPVFEVIRIRDHYLNASQGQADVKEEGEQGRRQTLERSFPQGNVLPADPEACASRVQCSPVLRERTPSIPCPVQSNPISFTFCYRRNNFLQSQGPGAPRLGPWGSAPAQVQPVVARASDFSWESASLDSYIKGPGFNYWQ